MVCIAAPFVKAFLQTTNAPMLLMPGKLISNNTRRQIAPILNPNFT
jgi:hypothetical protein